MANKIQIKRGLKSNLPTLNVGEPALCTDTKEVFIGSASGNVQLAKTEYISNPNLLINGDFQVWQRGTLLECLTRLNYTCDRWLCSTDFPKVLIEKDNEFLKVTAKEVNNDLSILQTLETADVIPVRGKKVTFSVNLKKYSNMSTGDIVLNIYTGTGIDEATSFTNRVVTTRKVSYSELTESPKLFMLTADIPNNANSISVIIRVGTFYGNQINKEGNFGIKNAKLEVGEIATPLSPRSYGEELALCERYCRKLVGRYPMSYYNADNIYFCCNEILNMRVSPSIVGNHTEPNFQIFNTNQGVAQSGFKLSTDSISIVSTKANHGLINAGIGIWKPVLLDAEIY